MIRPMTIVTFLMACGSGLYLYQAKHAAQVLDRDIERTVRETGSLREQSRLLAAEWTMLNDPETLRKFSDQYLALKSIAPTQFTSLTDLRNRLPAVEIMTPSSGPANTTDEDEGAPVAISGNDQRSADPVISAPASAPPAPAAVAARESKLAPSVAPPPAVPAVVAAAKPPADRPTERKIVVAVAKPPPPVMKVPETRAVEPRPAEPRVAEAHPADARPAAPGPAQAPAARPTILAASAPAAVRAVPASAPAVAPAYVPAAASAPSAYSGSLLGMARSGGSPAPVPRPMPVSTAQWSNAN
jgi:hypothetical protein